MMFRNRPYRTEHVREPVRRQRLGRCAAAIAFVVAFSLLAAGLAVPRATHAEDPPLTVSMSVEGYDAALPTLVEGTDFTRGSPIGSDPRFMAASDGGQPLAALVEAREAQGLTLVWRDQNGSPFDWLSTPVTSSLQVNGSFEETTYEVRVSLSDEATDDLVATVKHGQSFKDAYGSTPTAPGKRGQEFVRWVDAANDSTFDFDAPVTASTTVYPEYRISEPAQVTTVDPTKDVPKTLTGRCYIGATWSVHPAKFNLSRFTGGLAGCSGTGTCSLPSAAAPSHTWANYTATLKSVDVEGGKVVYDVHITPPGAASPGGPRNSLGLIGYQTVAFQAVVQKNFGGYLEISKSSAHPKLNDGNATYSLKGAVFGVYDKNGACVARLTTDEKGKTERSGLLPAGTYTVVEEQAPRGYAPANECKVAIESGKTSSVSVSDMPQSALIDLVIGKVDAETSQPFPLGSASLAGARFKVSYFDRHLSADEAVAAALEPVAGGGGAAQTLRNAVAAWGSPKRSWTFEADADGMVAFDEAHLIEGDAFYRDVQGDTALPLGVVAIEEVRAPNGYLKSNALIVRDIRAEGTDAHVSAWAKAAYPEQVVRGDFSFTKVRSDTMERLAGVPFRITSKTTGEAHVIVTDENGMANTAASWTPHTQNTNAGQSAHDGVWFGLDANGTEAPVDDALGALPFDSYTVEELPSATNEGLTLVTFTVTINRNAVALDLGTIDDEAPDHEISGEVDKRETLIDSNGAFAYTIDYRSTSDTWADEFNMTDEIACAQEGLAQLVSLTTPVCFEDYDGLMNVWYRTNLDDKAAEEGSAKGEAVSSGNDGNEATPDDANGDDNGSAEPSELDTADADARASSAAGDTESASTGRTSGAEGAPASSGAGASDEPTGNGEPQPNACASNPFSKANPNNERVRDFSGWRVWATDVSTLEASELAVSDLDLADGEWVIAIAFEHGRVEEGFGTNAQDAKAWDRRDRYERIDLAESLEPHDATFDPSKANGPTKADQEAIVAYAPAILQMQATEQALAEGAEELWNDAAIDIHRDLELHDDDKDSVVQSIDPVKTIVESPDPVDTAKRVAASKLPKTDDLARLTPFVTACVAAAGLTGLATSRTLRRSRIKRAMRANL